MVSIVIPTKNEELNISDIIRQCLSYADEVVVVDGHSTDRTRDIAKDLGCKVILDGGRGKGEAIRKAIGHVMGDIIVFIDADGSHDPGDIPNLIQPIKENAADHVSGSRMTGGSDELHGDVAKFIRMIGSAIITLGINYRFNVRLTDSQNGFRAIKTEVARSLNLREDITTIEQEMVIKTLRRGYKIAEIPAHEYERKHGHSHIKVSRVAFRYVYSWLKYMFLPWT